MENFARHEELEMCGLADVSELVCGFCIKGSKTKKGLYMGLAGGV